MSPSRLDSSSNSLASLAASAAVFCLGTYCYCAHQKSSRKSSDESGCGSNTGKNKSGGFFINSVPCTTTKPGSSSSLQKKGITNNQMIADNLLCPITLELPLSPVTAEDGRVYERAAIEKHFATKKASEVIIKSPVTNEIISTRLLPAPMHRNIIEALIESGTLSGGVADKWMEKIQEKRSVESLLKRADQNDLKSMETVALNYFRGEHGFKEDDKQAYRWFQKCHRAGSVLGTAHIGYMLASGVGVPRNKKEGIVYLGIAAGKGSDMAAYRLGMAWADGKYGLQINDTEATYWLQLSIGDDCSCKTMNDKSTKKAKQKLEDVKERNSASSRLSLEDTSADNNNNTTTSSS